MPSQTIASSWMFGEVGSGVQLPTSLALSLETLSLGEAEGEEAGQPASQPHAPWPPLDPFKTARAASLCWLKLFSFRTGQRRGAGGGEVTPVVELERRLIYKCSGLGILAELMSGGEGHQNACL